MSRRKVEAGRAYVLIEAIDKTPKALNQLAKNLDQIGWQIGRLGLQAAALATTMAAPLGVAAERAMAFTDQMRLAQGIMGISKDQADALGESVLALAQNSSYTSAQAAEAAKNFGRMGMNAKQIERTLPFLLQLARGAEIELAEGALVMGRSMSVFGETSKKVVDGLFNAASSSTTSVTELAQAMSFSGNTAAQMGLSFDQTAAALAVMSDQMLFGTKGGTSFNQMLIRMAGRADIIRDKLGVNLIEEGTGQFVEFEQGIKGIADALNSMPPPERIRTAEEIFNVRGARAANTMIARFDKYTEVLQKIQKEEGAAARAAEIADSDMGGAWRRILSQLDVIAVEVGKSFGMVLQEFEKNFAPILKGTIEFVKNNRQVVVTYLKLVGAVAAAAASLIGLAIAFKSAAFFAGVLSTIITMVLLPIKGLLMAVVGLSSLIGTIGAAFGFLISPIGQVILLVGILSSLFLDWKKISISVGESLGETWAKLVLKMQDSFGGLWDTVKIVFDQIIKFVKAGDIEGALEVAVDGMKLIWQEFANTVETQMTKLKFVILNIWNEIKTGIQKRVTEARSSTADWLLWLAQAAGVKGKLRDTLFGENVRIQDVRKALNEDTQRALEQINTDRAAELNELEKNQKKALESLEIEAAFNKMMREVFAEGEPGELPKSPEPEPTDLDVPPIGAGEFSGAAAATASLPSALMAGTAEAMKRAYMNQQRNFDTITKKAAIETAEATAETAETANDILIALTSGAAMQGI